MREHHERNLRFGEPDFNCRFHRTADPRWLPFPAYWSLSPRAELCYSAPKICSPLPKLCGIGGSHRVASATESVAAHNVEHQVQNFDLSQRFWCRACGALASTNKSLA